MSKSVVIQTNQITKDLLHQISISKDERSLTLKVDLLSGRFTIEKSFSNNFGGLYMMERTVESFNSEEKVCKYLKIGEINERNEP